MATDEEIPRGVILRVLSGSADTCAEVSIELLQLLANSLSTTIGEDGFESLLHRAARQVAKDHRWLTLDPRALPADPEFELLPLCFDAQDPVQVQAASQLLFTTFIDILAKLIGPHMTTMILNSALGRARTGTISKEQQDD